MYASYRLVSGKKRIPATNHLVVFPIRDFPNPKPVFLAIFYHKKPVIFSATKPGYLKITGIAVASKY